jgi:hypothetical protein
MLFETSDIRGTNEINSDSFIRNGIKIGQISSLIVGKVAGRLN